VKTSILLLDKTLARKSDTIAFFKVEADGYDLGAQRRPIQKNDLPKVQEELESYLATLRERKDPSDLSLTTALIVPKEKIATNGDYNLSAERYREGVVSTSSWPLAKVGDAFRKGDRSVLPESLDGPVTYIGLENITQNTGSLEGEVITSNPSEIKSLKNVFEPGNILYGKLRPNLNKVWIADREGICSTDIFVIEADEQKAMPDLFAYVFRSKRFNDSVMAQLKGAQLPRVGWSSFSELEIPLPPLEIQKEIVAEIQGYQKIINGARAVLDNYRPHIPIDPDWPMGSLSDVCTLVSGQHIDKEDYNTEGIGVDYLTGPSDFGFKHPIATRWTSNPKVFAEPGDILMTVKGSGLGSINILGKTRAAISRQLMAMRINGADPEFIYALLLAKYDHIQSLGGGAAIPGITRDHVLSLEIPLPPLAEQQAIVAEIEAEQALVNANRELITRFEAKIQTTLSRIWGDESSVS
jgi:type I restriction enzyme M protein